MHSLAPLRSRSDCDFPAGHGSALDVSATLTDEARKRDVGAFFKSIHGTLNHLLLADRVWLARFEGVPPPDGHMAPVYQRAGKRHESPLWSAVAHLFNHQTHHRGQITTLLMQQGHDPGVTDLMGMVREEAAIR